MNFGGIQLANMTTNAPSKAVSSTRGTDQAGNKFGDVFSQVVVKANNPVSKAESIAENTTDLKQIQELLNSDSVEELFELLGIGHDDSLLMVQTNEDGQFVAMDELMNLEDMLAVLDLDLEEIVETLQQLLGDEDINSNNLWELINLVNEQSPNLIAQVTSAMQGEHKVTPRNAEQLVQLLKFAEVVSKTNDLTNEQYEMINQLKDGLQNLLKSIESVQVSQTAKSSIHGFQQVIQKVIKNTETQEFAQAQPVQTTSVSTKTVTITLPAEKPAQPEALSKEIQNLLNRSQFSNSQGTMKLLLKLYPENLGSIRIEIMQKDGIMTARLLASTSMGKELLDNQIQQLKTAFAQQNIQMDRIDIAQSLQETDRNLRDQNLFGNLFKQQSDEEDEEQEENDQEESISFSEYLLNEEV